MNLYEYEGVDGRRQPSVTASLQGGRNERRECTCAGAFNWPDVRGF
jgi:hypothetical protein